MHAPIPVYLQWQGRKTRFMHDMQALQEYAQQLDVALSMVEDLRDDHPQDEMVGHKE